MMCDSAKVRLNTKIMSFALKLMNSVVKKMNLALQMMKFAF